MTEPDAELLDAEIAEQPAVIARLLEQQHDPIHRLARVIRGQDPRAIVLVARGSSDNAAVYGRYLFEICNRRLTSLAAPSAVTLYDSGPMLAGTVVIGVSQSGQGEDVVAYLRDARQQGATTVAIVNDESSPLAGAAEWVLACMAGPELSVPATKTVTAQMTLLAMLSGALADAPAQDALASLPGAVQQALDRREAAANLARQLESYTTGAVVGRGFAFPPALELALKLKETSYTQAEPFSAADFLHGPVALVEPDYFAFLLDAGGRSSEAADAMYEAVQQRGGHPVRLRAEGDLPEPYAPIPLLVLGQRLAIEVAHVKGLDPARPRGLRKVTSTR